MSAKNGHESLPATESDVDAGRAVFWIADSRSKVYDLGCRLPAEARLKHQVECGQAVSPIPAGTRVTIVQAEIVDDRDVLIGFFFGTESGVCVLSEVELEGLHPAKT